MVQLLQKWNICVCTQVKNMLCDWLKTFFNWPLHLGILYCRSQSPSKALPCFALAALTAVPKALLICGVVGYSHIRGKQSHLQRPVRLLEVNYETPRLCWLWDTSFGLQWHGGHSGESLSALAAIPKLINTNNVGLGLHSHTSWLQDICMHWFISLL